MITATGMLKAGVKLADVVASATGKQLNILGSKLGMDKDMLKGMDANKIKTAIMDEGQVYIKNMRKNQNRRTGTAAITGLAGGAAAYGVSDFIGDMLGIKKVGDGTLKGKSTPVKTATKKKTTKSKTKTYAEMVKEDKAKGKAKVLARRDKNKKPEPKPIPKGLRESIAKDKKKTAVSKGKVKASASNTKDFAKTKKIQEELNKMGADINADGIMGAKTRAAMAKYKAKPKKVSEMTTKEVMERDTYNLIAGGKGTYKQRQAEIQKVKSNKKMAQEMMKTLKMKK